MQTTFKQNCSLHNKCIYPFAIAAISLAFSHYGFTKNSRPGIGIHIASRTSVCSSSLSRYGHIFSFGRYATSTETYRFVHILILPPPHAECQALIAQDQGSFENFSDFPGLTSISAPKRYRLYTTTISVLEGSLSPALLTAMMRYSSSFPFACSTNCGYFVLRFLRKACPERS